MKKIIYAGMGVALNTLGIGSLLFLGYRYVWLAVGLVPPERWAAAILLMGLCAITSVPFFILADGQAPKKKSNSLFPLT